MSEFNLRRQQAGKSLTLAKAREWIARFTQSNDNEVISNYFGENVILRILATNRCIGIRAYVATDENNTKQVLLVGVDEAGENLIPLALPLEEEEPIIAAPASNATFYGRTVPL